VRPALLSLFACLLYIWQLPAFASVVLTGTRIIYPAALSGKTLHFSNDDAHPWLVQAWLDAGDEASTPETLDETIPFALSPPIFRMDSHSGQALRLMFTGSQELPKDRESVFYFNFTQIPALGADELDANRLVMLLRNRVKVFYRPHRLRQPDLGKMACALRFHLNEDEIEVENPAAFHAVIRSAELHAGDHRVPLVSGQMLAPFSQHTWPLAEPVTVPAGAQLRVTLVNDYGADESHDCPWR